MLSRIEKKKTKQSAKQLGQNGKTAGTAGFGSLASKHSRTFYCITTIYSVCRSSIDRYRRQQRVSSACRHVFASHYYYYILHVSNGVLWSWFLRYSYFQPKWRIVNEIRACWIIKALRTHQHIGIRVGKNTCRLRGED